MMNMDSSLRLLLAISFLEKLHNLLNSQSSTHTFNKEFHQTWEATHIKLEIVLLMSYQNNYFKQFDIGCTDESVCLAGCLINLLINISQEESHLPCCPPAQTHLNQVAKLQPHPPGNSWYNLNLEVQKLEVRAQHGNI